jgi:uncharacterized membrane protein
VSADKGQGTFWQTLRDNPAAQQFTEQAGKYAAAKAASMAPAIINKVAGGGAAGNTAQGATEGITKAGKEGKGKLGTLMSTVGGAFKGMFKSSGSKRPTAIVEHLFIGAPVDVVFDRWADYQDWAKFMKGPESVDITSSEDEEEQSNWKAKVWWSRRSWTATVTEFDLDEKIKWKTEANKGTVDGVVTFTPLGENLTLVVLVIEYRSKGAFEWTANRWRAVGRRARLDLKHFSRHVMMLDAEEQQTDRDDDQSDEQDNEQNNETETEAETSETETSEAAEEQDKDDNE